MIQLIQYLYSCNSVFDDFITVSNTGSVVGAQIPKFIDNDDNCMGNAIYFMV